MRLAFLLAVLAAFTVYSASVVIAHGYTGFLAVSAREPWAMQMLLDLFIALTLFSIWMVRDARTRGINPWPYVVACVLLGSVGAMGYLVRRELGERAARASAAKA